MSELRKTLKEMAQLSILANKISEVQEKNIKMFPFIFFDDVKTVTVDYDLGHGVKEGTKEVHHASRVTYQLELNEAVNEAHLDKRFLALETSIRELFWKDVVVQVHFNGKKVFESKDV